VPRWVRFFELKGKDLPPNLVRGFVPEATVMYFLVIGVNYALR
jgi:hypothetical protein